MNRTKLWPHGILIVLAFASVAAIVAALWTKYERSAEAKALPNAARIERVEGQVGVSQSLDNSNSQWVEAKANSPITVGDRIYTRENSRSQIAFTGRNFATVDANTALDVLDLSAQRTQIALRNGSALFDVGAPAELFEVATPSGAVVFQEPGMGNFGVHGNGNAVATAYSGGYRVVGQGGAGRSEKGETLAIPYQAGYWTTDYPYGLTWVSSEPWGYAPYHYGRWTYASNSWFWIPEPTRSYPTYSPALVAFLPLGDSSVGWVALGPSDPYAPRYYDSNWQPVYTASRDVYINQIANMRVPGAVTVVPVQRFTQVT